MEEKDSLFGGEWEQKGIFAWCMYVTVQNK